jgi:hypothetical protein
MKVESLPWEGGCRCGQVRFRISAPPLLTGACHCIGCQRMTGGAFSLAVVVSDKAFEVTKGEPVIGGLHGEVPHYFCPYCMSWMFTRVPGAPMINVRATRLDDTTGFEPFVETYTSEKLPWAKTPAVHAFDTFPEPEAWPGLMEAYAGRER